MCKCQGCYQEAPPQRHFWCIWYILLISYISLGSYHIIHFISYHTFYIYHTFAAMNICARCYQEPLLMYLIFDTCHIFIYFISYICQGCHGCYQEAPPRRHLIPHRSHINTAHCIMEASTQENCSQTRNSQIWKSSFSYICWRVAALVVASNMFEDTSYIADVSQESKQGHQTSQNISFEL